VVIHGHTHSAKAYEVGAGMYINAGTWARLLRLPDSEAPLEEWRDFLTGLANGADSGTARPTFARVIHEDDRTSATLFQWEDGAASAMSEWVSQPNARGWIRR
jgi:hypothetical protein